MNEAVRLTQALDGRRGSRCDQLQVFVMLGHVAYPHEVDEAVELAHIELEALLR